jgi:hypothetical protein
MSLAGLELNATYARAVSGPDGIPPLAVLLDGDDADLPMAVSLEKRRPEVGRAGAALCRQYPHLACVEILPRLGTSHTWGARRPINGAKAMGLVFERLKPALAGASALVIASPGYLVSAQVQLLLSLARKAKVPIVGSIPVAVACAVTAHADRALSGLVPVIDADDHALTWSLLKVGEEKLQPMASKAFPDLGLRAWKSCLLDAIADTCVHHSRRDPRDTGSAEQLLYDQLDDVLALTAKDQMVEVVIRSTSWCQNLILQPQQVRTFSDALLQDSIEEIRAAVALAPDGFPRSILVTAAASQLPGMIESLRSELPEPTEVVTLPSDAAPRGAHRLAARFQRRELPQEHVQGPLLLTTADPGSASHAKHVISMF